MKTHNRHAASAAAILALTAAAGADVVTITPDRDNTLIEDEQGLFSNGAGQQVFAGRILFGSARRAAIRFPTSAIPAGSTVESVTVELYMSQTTSGPFDFSLHRLAADWGEGTSNGSGSGGESTDGDATWIHRFFPDVFWTAPGGDFVPTASATQSVGGTGEYRYYTWGSTAALVADVQGWVNDPATNFGWLLIGGENVPMGQRSAKRFEGRSTIEGTPPRMIVTFTPPATSCPADWDDSGAVEPADVAAFVSAWFNSLVQGTTIGDFDDNGAVDPADVAAFVTAWFVALQQGGC